MSNELQLANAELHRKLEELTQAKEEIARLKQACEYRVTELETMLAVTPVGIAICEDPKGETIRTNDYGAKLLGVADKTNIANRRDALECPRFTLYSGTSELKPNELPIRAVMTSRRAVYNQHIRIVRADGSEVEVLISASPLFDENDEVRGAIAAFADVTERVRGERLAEAIAIQQAILARLGMYALSEGNVSKVMDEIVTTTAKALDTEYCEILEFLPENHQLSLRAGFGWPSELMGKVTVDADPRTQAGYTLRTNEVVIVDDFEEGQFARAPLFQEYDILSGVTVPIKGLNGLPYGVLGVHSTAKHRFSESHLDFLQAVANLLTSTLCRQYMEVELRNVQRRLTLAGTEAKMRQAERLSSLGTLAAGIAHDINNPLNSILMNAELGLMALAKKADQDRLTMILRRIVDDAKRGGKIIRNILQFSKADHYAPEGLASLNQIVRRLQNMVAPILHSAKASLEIELAEDLPELELNPTAIEQAVVNLINNAAEAGATRIWIRTMTEGPYVIMTVSDDGAGIPAENLEHIFDPFFTTHREQGGTGLGLSLVHRIVTDHDGTVDVESAPGEGSKFVVRLCIPSKEKYPDAQDSGR